MNFFSRQNEIILVFNAIFVFGVALATHVNFHYLVLLVLFVSLTTLLMYSRLFRIGPLLVVPLLASIALLIGLQIVAHNVPGVAFYHEFLDSKSPVPIIAGEMNISFVIPIHNEKPEYVAKTIEYIMRETPARFLKEIILVDDNSNVVTAKEDDIVQVLRMSERVGLTNAKIYGAQRARGTHIMFLDAHCRVGPFFAERMLARMETYRDIVVPEVIDVDGESFRFNSMDGGVKMMFDWTFDFSWFGDDADDFVPVSSGGILVMTRRFFHEGGQYDSGMLEWGGENIEQSLRTWQCGGRIIVEREAKVGHVFTRVLAANRISHIVVERNHARAAFVWLDDSLRFFQAKYPAGNTQITQLGPGIDSRLELRNRLECKGFEYFESKFDRVFDQSSLSLDAEFSIQHVESGLCLTALAQNTGGKVKERPVKLEWRNCERYSDFQRFSPTWGSNRIRNIAFQRCLERKNDFSVELELCDYLGLKPTQNFVHKDERITSTVEAAMSLRKDGYCLQGPQANEAMHVVKCSTMGNSIDITKLYLGL